MDSWLLLSFVNFDWHNIWNMLLDLFPKVIGEPQPDHNLPQALWIYGTWGIAICVVQSSVTRRWYFDLPGQTSEFGIIDYELVVFVPVSSAQNFTSIDGETKVAFLSTSTVVIVAVVFVVAFGPPLEDVDSSRWGTEIRIKDTAFVIHFSRKGEEQPVPRQQVATQQTLIK